MDKKSFSLGRGIADVYTRGIPSGIEAEQHAELARNWTLPSRICLRASTVGSALLAIADHAGGDWRDRARKAAVRLAKVADATSIRVQLLTDIKGRSTGCRALMAIVNRSSVSVRPTLRLRSAPTWQAPGRSGGAASRSRRLNLRAH